MNVGQGVYRFRWLIVAAWLATAAMLVWLVPPVDPSVNERESFLPDSSPHRQAIDALKRAFPDNSGISQAAVIFERTPGARGPDDGGGLTPEDFGAIEAVARRIREPRPDSPPALLAGVSVQSPAMVPGKSNPFISPVGPNGQAAIVLVEVPANFITSRSVAIVDHIREVLAKASLPAGLNVAVSGSAGIGRDYAHAATRSHNRTLLVTLAAVLTILLLVYRSPLAAMAPLVAVSLAAAVAWKLLELLSRCGMHVGTAEQIFVLVLLYGAGVDYSLLVLARYRELLSAGEFRAQAAPRALNLTLAAIVASALTNIAALLMMCFAQYGIFRSTGPAVAVALTVALLAAVTLVPAMMGAAGKAMFWPSRQAGRIGLQFIWPPIARVVTRRPLVVMLLAAGALAAPAVEGMALPWSYDTTRMISADVEKGIGNGVEGIEMAKRHWPVGEVTPVVVLVEADKPLAEAKWLALSDVLGDVVRSVGPEQAVSNIRSLGEPLGHKQTFQAPPVVGTLLGPLSSQMARRQYVSRDMKAMRMEVVLGVPAMTPAAMRTVEDIRQSVGRALEREGVRAAVHMTGATAEMIDIRRTTRNDFYLIVALVLAVILLVVLGLLRDVLLSVFMVASTVLSYLATLGLTYWVFAFLGYSGLDWKVEVFLFVVMVAVGQDYNIFLAARLAQEARRHAPLEAVRVALVHTGPVISSCGLIMAATLGSLMVGELPLLLQLGFAMSLGMLIDTFVVRPLLLPAFAAVTGRTGKGGIVG
jgi:RND superfamily putative drug exporter